MVLKATEPVTNVMFQTITFTLYINRTNYFILMMYIKVILFVIF